MQKHFYYYVIRKDDSVYTMRTTYHVIKENLNDPQAKHIVPIGFFDWIRLTLKFGSRK